MAITDTKARKAELAELRKLSTSKLWEMFYIRKARGQDTDTTSEALWERGKYPEYQPKH